MSEKWTVKCPLCGTELPNPTLSEVRTGSCVWSDGQIGKPELVWISKCSNSECGFLFLQREKYLTKYPSMYLNKTPP
jgi:hypothetical protein